MSDADHDPRNFELRNHTKLEVRYLPPVYFKNDNATARDIEMALALMKSGVPQAFIGKMYFILAVDYYPGSHVGYFSMTITMQQDVN